MKRDHRVAITFLLLGIALVASLSLTFWIGDRSLQASAALTRHEALTRSLMAAFSMLQDAETGQRGYLLAREEDYLVPFQTATKEIVERLADLEQFVRSGEIDRNTFHHLKEVAEAKMAELQRTIDLARSGQEAEAVNILRQGSGKALMDEFRSVIGSSLASEDKQRAQTASLIRQAKILRYATYGLVLLGNLLFLSWAYHRIEREKEQRRQADLEACRQRDLLAITLTSIGDAVIIADRDGSINYMNRAAEDLTGWDMEAGRRQPCSVVFRIINEHTREVVESPVERVLRSGRIIGLANHTVLITKNGKELPIDDSGAPIRAESGTIQGVVLVFRDISDRREAERKIVAANEALKAANQAKDR